MAFQGRAAFYAPVGENRQLGGAVWADTQGNVRAHVGYRVLADFPEAQLTTRLEGALLFDLRPAFGIGAHVAAGVGYEFARGWQVGPEVGVAIAVVHLAAVFELGATVAYLF